MKIEIDQASVDAAAAEENLLGMEVQIQHLMSRTVQLNATIKKLVARVEELEAKYEPKDSEKDS